MESDFEVVWGVEKGNLADGAGFVLNSWWQGSKRSKGGALIEERRLTEATIAAIASSCRVAMI